MLEIKENLRKSLKLKANPYTTEESLISKLNFTLNVQEFTLSIKSSINFNLVFSKVKEFLMQQKELTKLTISLENINNLDFETTFYLLKDIITLTQLKIEFNDQINLNSIQTKTLSNCLSGFFNLQSLHIKLDYEYFHYQEKYFCLYDVYTNIPNLKKLEIELTEVIEGQIIYNFFEGIKQLQKLESLSISLLLSNIRFSQVLYCIEHEIKELHNLTSLSIYLGWKCQVTHKDLCQLGNILKCLQKLDNLRIQLHYINRNKKIDLLGLEDSITSLPNLKHVNFKYKGGRNVNILYMLDSFQQIQSLESINIDLSIQEPQFYNDNFETFGQALGRIKKLSELKLDFSFYCKISVQSIVTIVSQLKQLKNLKSIIIYSSFLEIATNVNNIDTEDFIIVLKNLTSFNFYVYEQNIKNNAFCANQIFHSIHQVTDIEDLNITILDSYHEGVGGTDLVQIDDLLKNKRKLKTLSFKIGKQYLLQEDQFQKFFNDISLNPSITRFEFIYKSTQSCSELFMKSLGLCLYSLKQLQKLEIWFGESSQINDQGFFSFCNTLQTLQQLQYLDLQINKDQLSIQTLIHFVSSFKHLKRVNSFQLNIKGSNFESQQEQKLFGDSFKLPPKLEQCMVELEIQNLEFQNLENIFEEISQERKLKHLKLTFSNFKITDLECLRLKNYFSNLKLINQIVFKCYQMRLLYLFNLFQEIQTLNQIILENEYKDSLDCKVIMKKTIYYEFNTQRQTQKFSLTIRNDQLISNQEFNLEDLESIPFVFQSLKPLNKFKILIPKQNSVSSKIATTLFNNMSYLTDLKELKLRIKDENQLSTESLITLSSTLLQMTQLKSLILKINSIGNCFNWKLADQFIQNIGRLTQLHQFQINIHFEESNYKLVEKSRAVLSLFESIQSLENLNSLNIKIVNSSLTEFHLESLDLMFKLLKNKLRDLTFKIKTVGTQEQIMKNLIQLQNLNYISLNQKEDEDIRLLLKLQRLVVYKVKKDEDIFN